MEETNTQQIASPREQLLSRMKERYPDRNFDGADSPNGLNSLEQSILDALTEGEDKYNTLSQEHTTYKDAVERLNNIFNTSPNSAVFFNELAASKDPSVAIYKAWGKDAHDAYLSGEASGVIAEIEAEDAKRRAEDEEFEQEKEANLKESFEALDAYGKEKGISEDELTELFLKAHSFMADALIGKYSREFFDMIVKAERYEGEIESARKEGEINGRNAKIAETTRRSHEQSAMPPQLSGQGTRAEESRPRDRRPDPFMLRTKI